MIQVYDLPTRRAPLLPKHTLVQQPAVLGKQGADGNRGLACSSGELKKIVSTCM